MNNYIKSASYLILARWHKYEYLIAKDRAYKNTLKPQIFSYICWGEGDIYADYFYFINKVI